MSYRTWVNDTQIFGNNEWYNEWVDFLKSEGIEIGVDGDYDGYITNLQGMFSVIDVITKRLIDERHKSVLAGETDWQGNQLRELTDLSESMWLSDDTPLLMFNMEMIEHAYCFLPYQVYKAVESEIEKSEKVYNAYKKRYCCSYRLKDGAKIHVHAG